MKRKGGGRSLPQPDGYVSAGLAAEALHQAPDGGDGDEDRGDAEQGGQVGADHRLDVGGQGRDGGADGGGDGLHFHFLSPW